MPVPRALDDCDHLGGRMDVDVLAEGPARQKSAGVDAGRQMRQRPPVVAVSQWGAGHEPAEGGWLAVGLANEIGPADAENRLSPLGGQRLNL